ncbi:MAG: hypothetical protein GY928_11450 [Colwellia sp.]|nr:hypothetical protein [Colwellia sp.]
MLEKDIQKKAQDYLNEWGLRWFHIPDPVLGFLAQNANSQIRNIISRELRGVPDLIIFSKSGEYNHCLLLELKAETGRLTQGQVNWHKNLNVAVTYGWDEAREAIDGFIKMIDEEIE